MHVRTYIMGALVATHFNICISHVYMSPSHAGTHVHVTITWLAYMPSHWYTCHHMLVHMPSHARVGITTHFSALMSSSDFGCRSLMTLMDDFILKNTHTINKEQLLLPLTKRTITKAQVHNNKSRKAQL